MIIYTCYTKHKEKRKKLIDYGYGYMHSSNPKCYPNKSDNVFENFAVDNGAYANYARGKPFNEYAFLKTISKLLEFDLDYDFIVCPDLVGQGLKSLDFSLFWVERLNFPGKLALVVNDEIPIDSLDLSILDKFSHIFISGGFTTDWESYVNFAHKKRKKVHIGRCGTLDRMRWAYRIGSDSVDSTCFLRNNKWHFIHEFKKPETQLSFF